MKSPSKSAALSDLLTKAINGINSTVGYGTIDGVEFDMRHEELDLAQSNVLSFLEDVLYLPNEVDDGRLGNQHAIWFPWFGPFDSKALYARVAKLKPKTVARMIETILAEKHEQQSGQKPIDQLITFLTPKYIVASGDRISICHVADAIVGGDHLHEHDRVVKKVSIKITNPNGNTTEIEPPYYISGNQSVVNPYEEAPDPFGSILFRIVQYQKLERPDELKRFIRGESEISAASAIAYDLYHLIEPAWEYAEYGGKFSPEEIEAADYCLHVASEAALLGYIWAKIEFEANLKPLADIAKHQNKISKAAGKKSGETRRKSTEEGWIKIAKILGVQIRAKRPELSQDDLAFEIGVLWTSDTKPPGSARIKQLIGEMEKSGELAKRTPKLKAKRQPPRS